MSPGADPRRRRIGLVPQELALVEELSARANLRFFGAIQGLHRAASRVAADACLEFVGLIDRANSSVRTFSGGMKRRLNLAAALMHDPGLIVLDEPTVGVDPQSRHAIFEGLAGLRDRGKSILYTTHQMDEAERLCDRVVIVDHGRVVADGPVAELAARDGAWDVHAIELDDSTPGPWLEELRRAPEVAAADINGERLVVRLVDRLALARLLGRLETAGRPALRVESARADLSTVFLSLTGRSLRDG